MKQTTKSESKEIQEAKQKLMKFFEADLKKGKCPELYTICKHVSSSGMIRHIDVIYIAEDRTPIKLNWFFVKLGLYNIGKNYNDNNADSLRVSGCGMDMGFSVVYNLGRVLEKELRAFKIVKGRNGDKKPETDAGYLLTQRWL